MIRITDQHATTVRKLSRLPVPEKLPDRLKKCNSRFWVPVKHGELAKAVRTVADERGYEIGREGWSLCRNDQGLIGVLDLTNGAPKIDRPEGITMSLGVRHSNDGYWALAVIVGAFVAICSNGLISGEYIVKRKHTTNIDIGDTVKAGFDLWESKVHEVGNLIERLEERQIRDDVARKVLVEAGRRKVLPWKELGKVDREWMHPTHDVFKPRTAWSLTNAYTAVIRDQSPRLQLKRIPQVRDLIDELVFRN